jgi:hypothetical protein
MIATQLLKILKLQRETFIRDVNGKKIITNYILYHLLEWESVRLQRLIGLENKRIISKEMGCKVRDVNDKNIKKFLCKKK